MGTIHDVRHFDSDMTGAPSTAGMAAAGRFLAILDACAVNGFNLKAVTSLTVANGVATATTDGDHGFRDYTVIRIEGATPAELNGDWKVQVTAGNTFTFETTAPDGPATGTLSTKTAPLGWTKEFSATHVGVYRPKTGLRHFFRVNDASAAFVAIRGYEVMTSSGDAGVNPFPTPTQLSGGVGMTKYSASTSYQQIRRRCLRRQDCPGLLCQNLRCHRPVTRPVPHCCLPPRQGVAAICCLFVTTLPIRRLMASRWLFLFGGCIS